MQVAGKHIVVIGAALSGTAAAILLRNKGASVFVSDAGQINATARTRLQKAGIPFEENGHSKQALAGEIVVLSPGVPAQTDTIQYYLKNNRPVYSEIEAASWFTDNKMVAISGSNGKTTVASWCAHTWDVAGKNHVLAGNIGYAFSDSITDEKRDIILEVSSFQLEHISTFKPAVSVLLNITPDHLDRYQYNVEHYAAAKLNMTRNQDSKDIFIYNFDDTRLRSHALALSQRQESPRQWGFSMQDEVPEGAFIHQNNIHFKFNNKVETFMPINEVGLAGKHNLYNGMATALAARAAEIKNEAIRESLQSFAGVEHRLEIVRNVDGVKYINDSKATNVNAVWFALDSFNVPLTLILGGRDKGNNYAELIPQIHEKVHTIIAIGESKKRIKEQLESHVPNFMEAASMGEAVRMARKTAKRNEIVLLSPACSSFDMFDNYEHRGKVFKEEVNKL